MQVEFVDNGNTNADYRGMNPKFVERVWAERRKLQSRRKAEREREQAALEHAQRQGSIQARKLALMKKTNPIIRGFEGTAQRRLYELCVEHEINPAAIISTCRVAGFVEYRHKFISIIASEFPKETLSLPQIAQLFGRRCHSSIINALRKKGCPSRGYPVPS